MTDEQNRADGIVPELRTISRLMDTSFGIPFTKWKFGMDSLIGLLPLGGDVAGMAISLYVIVRAQQLGVSGKVIAKMLGNVVVDTALGSVPVAGDIFDVYFKANQRNVQLLLEEFPELNKDIQPVTEIEDDDRSE